MVCFSGTWIKAWLHRSCPCNHRSEFHLPFQPFWRELFQRPHCWWPHLRLLRALLTVCGGGLTHQQLCVRARARSLQFCNPMDCSPPGPSVHGILQARILEKRCHTLLQGTFQTQGSNLCLFCLLHLQAGSFPLVPPGKPPGVLETVMRA